MGVDVKIENATINGEMIDADIVVNVDEFGLKFSKTQHIKTNKDVEKDIDLGGGFTLAGVLSVEPPNQVCITGKLKQGFFSFDLGKTCTPLG